MRSEMYQDDLKYSCAYAELGRKRNKALLSLRGYFHAQPACLSKVHPIIFERNSKNKKAKIVCLEVQVVIGVNIFSGRKWLCKSYMTQKQDCDLD